jgi:hypothetical protein
MSAIRNVRTSVPKSALSRAEAPSDLSGESSMAQFRSKSGHATTTRKCLETPAKSGLDSEPRSQGWERAVEISDDDRLRDEVRRGD